MDKRYSINSDDDMYAVETKKKTRKKPKAKQIQNDFQENGEYLQESEEQSYGRSERNRHRTRKKNIPILESTYTASGEALANDVDQQTSKHARKKRRDKRREEESNQSGLELGHDMEDMDKHHDTRRAKRKPSRAVENTEPEEVNSERPKSRSQRRRKKYDDQVEKEEETSYQYHRAEPEPEETHFEKPIRKHKKKPKQDHVEMGDTGYMSQQLETTPTKQKRKKKQKRYDEMENEETEEFNGHQDEPSDGDLREALSQKYGPTVTVHPTRVVMCKPKDDVDIDFEYDLTNEATPSPKPRTSKGKKSRKDKSDEVSAKPRKKKSLHVDDTILLDDASDFEPLKPSREGSYLDNDISNHPKALQRKTSTKRGDLGFDEYEEESPKIDTKFRKKKSLAKLVQKKKEKEQSDLLSYRDSKVSKHTAEFDGSEASPKQLRLLREKHKNSESEDTASVNSQHDSASKKSSRTNNDRSKSHRKQSKHEHSASPRVVDKSSALKTSVMPFKLSDDSSSEDEGPHSKPTTSKRDSKKAFRPPLVKKDSLFESKLDNEDSSEEDIDNASEEDSHYSEESEDEQLTPPPVKKKDKKSKKAEKERKISTTESVMTQGEKNIKSYGKPVDLMRMYANGVKPSPKTNRKPPRPERKSVHGYPGPQRADSPTGSMVSSVASWVMKGIFSIDSSTYDVFMKEDRIVWMCVTGGNKVPKSRRKSYVRRISESSLTSLDITDTEEKNTIFYRDLLAVDIRRDSKKGHKEGGGVCLGVKLFTFDEKEGNRMKIRELQLDHPSESECVKWVDRLRGYLNEFEERPRRLKVFVQRHAGKKQGMLTFNTHVLPLFMAAAMTVDIVQVQHNEHIKQEMTHLEMEDYDCLVCVGGDGTVTRIVNQLLDRQQEKNGCEMTVHLTPLRAELKIGIIPTGMTNQIAQSVQGVSDAATAAIHIVLGNSKPVDICSVFQDDQFFKWSFMCHYGYFANTLAFVNRYTILGEKKLEAAFVKALSKAKLRAYQCEVKFMPASSSDYGTPMDHKACYEDCSRCRSALNLSQESVYSDDIEDLNARQDSDAEEVVELTEKSQWKTLKGDYLNVSLLAIPGRGEYSPLGMSKFSHLANGCLDLVLAKHTTKKEFARFLKRHGNAKNQFDFPFIETYRCKEVRFMLRLKNTWKHTDHKFNEIEYEIDKAEKTTKVKEKHSKDKMEVIDDLGDDNEGFEPETESEDSDSDSWDDDDDDEDATVSMFTTTPRQPKNDKSGKPPKVSKKKAKKQLNPDTLDDESDISDESEEQEMLDYNTQEEEETKGGKQKSNKTEKEEKKKQEKKEKEKKEKEDKKGHKRQGSMSSTMSKQAPEKDPDYIAPPKDYIIDQDRARRNRHKVKKDDKKRFREDRRMRSYWNFDNELQTDMNLHFKINNGLVSMYGAGVKREYEPSEVKMGCLSFA